MISIAINKIAEELSHPLRELEHAGFLSISSTGVEIEALEQEKGLSLTKSDDKAQIKYSNKAEFIRAISHLLQGETEVAETAAFKANGYMLDCSRNAVASISAVKRLIRHMALMGLNTLQLYTEDTFEIPEWKYFGYLRGRYTKEELKELDSYAEMFGIELIPCVQTLAHLNEALRWPEFHDIIDCDDIMLVGEEKTYRFLDDMIRTLSECFTSRNINIGMDEAHMLGLGKYLDKHGYQNRSDIMTTHLSKVVEICKKYDFMPMMWSDMFFRLAYKGEYYVSGEDAEADFPPEMLEKLRSDVKLVYWDYYSKDKNHYNAMIKRHQKFPNEIVFAGGAYKWNGLTPDLKFSYDATRASLAANIEEGIEEVFSTGWGDDGAETPAFVILPILQLHAEISYKGADVSEDTLRARFKTCTKGNWDDFFMLDTPNFTSYSRENLQNTTKPLLYQDVMLGLFDRHVDPNTFPIHFKVCAKQLKKAAKRNPEWSYIFTHTALISKVLSQKAALGIEIRRAYNENNNEELRNLAFKKLKKVKKKIKRLALSFENVWLKENKPHGLEVIHIRLGGVEVRLRAASRRLKSYISGKANHLEELESERLTFNGDETKSTNAHCNMWGTIVTPSRMSWFR